MCIVIYHTSFKCCQTQVFMYLSLCIIGFIACNVKPVMLELVSVITEGSRHFVKLFQPFILHGFSHAAVETVLQCSPSRFQVVS